LKVVDGGLLGVERFFGDVEVLAGAGDGARRVVVELRVLVSGHDRASAERLDPVYGLAPAVQAREPGLAEVQVGAVVDDVTAARTGSAAAADPLGPDRRRPAGPSADHTDP
jgi:hypothetical protein